ncbi:MAG: FliH/SctL family protein [Candidatus Riflebacteria bacterium]|nr:FliH/SctL family protein [Candidatus Riflebacteria bacterium]
MGKIFKASQIKIDTEKPVFIQHHQKIAKPEVLIDPAEDAFAEEAFRALSPEHLAGSGEKILTKTPEGGEDEPEVGGDHDSSEAKPAQFARPESFLSQAARKSRHAAVLEAIKVKELELEALEEELKSWEASLQQKERELTTKEQEMSQAMIKRRQEVEVEAARTLQMAKEAANSIAEASRSEAEALKKAARLEVDSLREKAYQEGYSAGEDKGRSAGEAEGLHEAELDWKNLMLESEALINELQTSRMGILKASEEEMLKLIISFAKSVIKVEPVAQPEIILRNIDMALNHVSEVDKIVMRINLRDKSMCQAHKDQFMARLSSVTELRIIEDASLSPGGIKIETGVGTIDATIESQARELEKALLEKFRKSQAGL